MLMSFTNYIANLLRLSYLKLYIILISIIITISIFFSTIINRSDFAQDYLAACAIRDGIDPNLSSLKLGQIYNVPGHVITSKQTAHPPLVTLLSLPFTALSWESAHLVWEIILCSTVAVLLLINRIRLADLMFLSPAWIFGLAFGNIDVVVVCLCLIAMSSCSPKLTGVVLGLAAALKVYPALLIIGFFLIGNYRQFFIASLTGGLLTLAATLCLGFDTLLGWLLYIPHNGNHFAVNMCNISITKLTVGMGIDNIIILSLGILLMLCLQKRQNTIDALIPGMLLLAPTSWLQQIAILSNMLKTSELVMCSICSITIILVWVFDFHHREIIGMSASVAMTCYVLMIYIRILNVNKVNPLILSKDN